MMGRTLSMVCGMLLLFGVAASALDVRGKSAAELQKMLQERSADIWSRVAGVDHARVFEANVLQAHGDNEAAFVEAQRAELNRRVLDGASAEDATANEVQAYLIVGVEDMDIGFSWAAVMDRLRTVFGADNVQAHHAGVAMVFAPARLAHKVAEVMEWEEISAVSPWMAAHKMSPDLQEEEGVCSELYMNADHTMDLTVTTTPMAMRDLIDLSSDLNAHLRTSKTEMVVAAVSVGAEVLHDHEHLPASTLEGAAAQRIQERDLRVSIRCEAALEVAQRLAEHPALMWVEARPVFHVRNKWAAGITQSSEVDNHFVWNQTLNGTGQVVGVSDTGLDASHCFFYDPDVPTPYDTTTDAHRKIVTYVTFVNDEDYEGGHGSHVSGSVLGEVYNLGDNYTEVEEFNGMAFGAKIAFFDIGTQNGTLILPPNIDANVFQPLLDAGAAIISNSWGASINTYDVTAKNSDRFMWDNPSALVLFAAGNDGDEGAHTVGAPATAKSIATIGCTLNSIQSWNMWFGETDKSEYNYDNVAFFSSQGPTADGRLKPDVMAPGYYTTSTYANAGVGGDFHCNTLLMAGTSMATPTTAGNTALIREYFMSGYYPTGMQDAANAFTPSGALLKAMLIHSASAETALLDSDGKLQNLGTPPDNIQGYGRIQLDNVLLFADSNNWFSLFVVGSATAAGGDLFSQFAVAGQSDSYTVTTGSDVLRELKFTLTWSDYPLLVGVTKNGSLVNDLSLSVENETSIWAVNDTQNPVNQIIISDPAPNTNYTVTVTADQILNGPQPYALVVSGNLAGVNFTYQAQPTPEDDVFVTSGDDDTSGGDDGNDNGGGGNKDDDDDDDSSGLSDGAIAGVVIGVIAGCALLFAGFKYYQRKQDGFGSSNYREMPNH